MKTRAYASHRLKLGSGPVVYYPADKASVSLVKRHGEPVFEVTLFKQTLEEIEGNTTLDWARVIVANELPVTFVRVHTPVEALDFLENTGAFLWSDPEEVGYTTDVSWADFQRWQLLVRQVMLEGFPYYDEEPAAPGGIRTQAPWDLQTRAMIYKSPHDVRRWLGGSSPNTFIEPNDEKEKSKLRLRVRFDVGSTVTAMLAQVAANGLNGINFHLCAREGCGELYKANHEETRRFCSDKCRNRDNVKRSRANTKKAAKKAKVKSHG